MWRCRGSYWLCHWRSEPAGDLSLLSSKLIHRKNKQTNKQKAISKYTHVEFFCFYFGTGAMAQWVSCCLRNWHLAAPLSVQLPANVPRKEVENRNWKKIPKPWLQIGSAPAITAMWGVNQLMEDSSLSLLFFLFLYNFLFQKNNF